MGKHKRKGANMNTKQGKPDAAVIPIGAEAPVDAKALLDMAKQGKGSTEAAAALKQVLTEATAEAKPYYGLSVNLIVKHDQPEGDLKSFLDHLPRGYEVVVVITCPDAEGERLEIVADEQQPDGIGRLVIAKWHYTGAFHFGNARNAALSLSTRDWVLWLDIDDRLHSGWDVLQELPSVPAGVAGIFCGCYGYQTLPADTAGSNYYAAEQLRIFRRYEGLQWAGWVHEQILPAIKRLGYTTTKMPLLIEHLGYAVDSAAMLDKYKRNMELLLLECIHGNKSDRRFYLKYLAGTIQTYLDNTKQEE